MKITRDVIISNEDVIRSIELTIIGKHLTQPSGRGRIFRSDSPWEVVNEPELQHHPDKLLI